ncbi:MAG: winged helix-turn-helix transcriptional regulator [Thermoanaerobaculia bacterium]
MGKRVDPQCRAFQSAIEVLSRPWNGLILGLLQGGPLRFCEIEEASHGLGPKTLSARLKALEARGLVVRSIGAGPPVRVSYSLTAKGQAFEKVTEAIERWGRDLVAEPATASEPKGRGGRAAS